MTLLEGIQQANRRIRISLEPLGPEHPTEPVVWTCGGYNTVMMSLPSEVGPQAITARITLASASNLRGEEIPFHQRLVIPVRAFNEVLVNVLTRESDQLEIWFRVFQELSVEVAQLEGTKLDYFKLWHFGLHMEVNWEGRCVSKKVRVYGEGEEWDPKFSFRGTYEQVMKALRTQLYEDHGMEMPPR